jgi:hypothetical protein
MGLILRGLAVASQTQRPVPCQPPIRYNDDREAIQKASGCSKSRAGVFDARCAGSFAVSQAPEVLAMILCDLIITDVESNKKSLIGLFDRVESAAMPCVVNELHVYLSLTDGHGSLPVAIACVAVDEGEELFRGHAEVEFADPLQVVELHFVFPSAQFPRPGEYRFQFLTDDVVLLERKFFVTYPLGEAKDAVC